MRLEDEEFKPCGYYTLEMHKSGELLTHVDELNKWHYDLTFIYQDQVVWAKICSQENSMFQIMFSGFGSGECTWEELLAMDARIHQYS